MCSELVLCGLGVVLGGVQQVRKREAVGGHKKLEVRKNSIFTTSEEE